MADVFLIGKWTNFEEMEDTLSIPELIAIANANKEKIEREQRFAAALQGIDLGTDRSQGSGRTFEEIMSAGGSDELSEGDNDIINLNGSRAAQAGFGIGLGLTYGTEGI